MSATAAAKKGSAARTATASTIRPARTARALGSGAPRIVYAVAARPAPLSSAPRISRERIVDAAWRSSTPAGSTRSACAGRAGARHRPGVALRPRRRQGRAAGAADRARRRGARAPRAGPRALAGAAQGDGARDPLVLLAHRDLARARARRTSRSARAPVRVQRPDDRDPRAPAAFPTRSIAHGSTCCCSTRSPPPSSRRFEFGLRCARGGPGRLRPAFSVAPANVNGGWVGRW